MLTPIPTFSNTQIKRARRVCWRKVPHDTLDGAQAEADRINGINIDSREVVAYQCAACLLYHVGRRRKTRNME